MARKNPFVNAGKSDISMSSHRELLFCIRLVGLLVDIMNLVMEIRVRCSRKDFFCTDTLYYNVCIVKILAVIPESITADIT